MRAIAVVVAVLAGVAAASAAPVRRSAPPVAGFLEPFGFAPTPGGAVAVLEDRGRRVLWATARGRTTPLAGPARPRAVAADSAGRVVVLDDRGDAGWWLLSFRDGRPDGEARCQGDRTPTDPVDAAFREGIVWVLDRSPPRVFLYAPDGASLGWTDLPAAVRQPFSVALGPAGEAFVTDPLGPAVVALSPAGSVLGDLDLDGTGVTRPTGVAVDDQGGVWTSDGVTGCVVRLSPPPPPGTSCGRDRPRFSDPLRLRWSDGGLWLLEGRAGRVRRIHTEEP